MDGKMKNILIFNDISGLGNCSLAANLPILSVLGHYAMPIVTGHYSCQTGFDGFRFHRNGDAAQFAQTLVSYRKPDAVYVGFGNDSDILRSITEFVEKSFGETFVMVDPVMGDNGKLYPVFDGEYAQVMRRLVRLADCITPNLTEACLLSGVDYDRLVSHKEEAGYLAQVGGAFENFLAQTGAKSAVITGVECGKLIGNVVLDGTRTRYVTNDRVNVTYSGTGDVFSSVLCGEILNGVSLFASTQAAACFVEKAARATECEDRRFGIEFGRVLNLL